MTTRPTTSTTPTTLPTTTKRHSALQTKRRSTSLNRLRSRVAGPDRTCRVEKVSFRRKWPFCISKSVTLLRYVPVRTSSALKHVPVRTLSTSKRVPVHICACVVLDIASKVPIHRNIEHWYIEIVISDTSKSRTLIYRNFPYIAVSNTDISYRKFRYTETYEHRYTQISDISDTSKSRTLLYGYFSDISDASTSRILIPVYRIESSDKMYRNFWYIKISSIDISYRTRLTLLSRTVYTLHNNISAYVCVSYSHQNRDFHPSACRKSSVLTAYSSKRHVHSYKPCGHKSTRHSVLDNTHAGCFVSKYRNITSIFILHFPISAITNL